MAAKSSFAFSLLSLFVILWAVFYGFITIEGSFARIGLASQVGLSALAAAVVALILHISRRHTPKQPRAPKVVEAAAPNKPAA